MQAPQKQPNTDFEFLKEKPTAFNHECKKQSPIHKSQEPNNCSFFTFVIICVFVQLS